MIYGKTKPHYTGLDCSGPCKVLPPTFEGVKALVARVGEDMARAQCALGMDSDDDDTPSQGLVRDFLYDFQQADKVERQTLVREFEEYVGQLEKSVNTPPAGKGKGEKEGDPTQGGEPIAEPAPADGEA